MNKNYKLGDIKNNSRISYLSLVRHGESLWNAKGLWTGWQDIALSAKGKKEARLAARILKDINFNLAFTSDLSRAIETLEIIKNELKLFDLPTIKDSAYKERHYGIYTGKNKSAVKREVGEVEFKKIRRGWNRPIPKGETLKDVYKRVISQYTNHIQPAILSGKNVLFVAHGNTNRALIKYLENISDENISEVEIATGEVIIYHFNHIGVVVKKEKRKLK